MIPALEQQAIWLQQMAEPVLAEFMKAYPDEVYIGISRLSDTASLESSAVGSLKKMHSQLLLHMKVCFLMKRTSLPMKWHRPFIPV